MDTQKRVAVQPTESADAFNRYFSPEQAALIREYQVCVNKGIDNFSDAEVAECKDLVGDDCSVQAFRAILGHERRKSVKSRGPAIYLASGLKHIPPKKRQADMPLFPCESTQIDVGTGEALAYSWVAVAELQVDAAYQRSDFINAQRIGKIARGWSWIKCQPLTVASREDGTKWIVDGQHRFLAALQIGVRELPCIVFESSGPAHEAKVFYDVNKVRTPMGAVSVYKALLCQGDAASVEINKILREFNMKIDKSTSIRQFKCADAIRKVYDKGVLRVVLGVINDAYGDGGSQRWTGIFSQEHFLQMMAALHTNKEWTLDGLRLRLVLARLTEIQYRQLVASCSGSTGSRGRRLASGFVDRFYNHGLRAGRLDPFA